jgi:hypothetical protein
VTRRERSEQWAKLCRNQFSGKPGNLSTRIEPLAIQAAYLSNACTTRLTLPALSAIFPGNWRLSRRI